jgi:hypothetical protein
VNDRRRAILFSGLSLAGLGLPLPRQAQAAAGPVSIEGFIALSARLCGRPAAQLSPDMAARILALLRAQGQMDGLAALRRDASADPVLARALCAAWFSGRFTMAGQDVLVGYHEALVWSSAPFLHAPGSCGGPTGYWSEPPRA